MEKPLDTFLSYTRNPGLMVMSVHEAGHMLALRHCFPRMSAEFKYFIDKSHESTNFDCPAVSRPPIGSLEMVDIEALQIVAMAGLVAEIVYFKMDEHLDEIVQGYERLCNSGDVAKAKRVVEMAKENGIMFPDILSSAHSAREIICSDIELFKEEVGIAYKTFMKLYNII